MIRLWLVALLAALMALLLLAAVPGPSLDLPPAAVIPSVLEVP